MQSNDVNHLIDAVVRQTMVLIAQLATVGGQRAPLAHVANQVFLGLVTELQNQGINQKVTADMFGLALRTYQRKRQRLMESATDRGRSLWEAVLEYVADGELKTRAEVLTRFRWDDENTVRGVLNDLVETGMVFKTGHGDSTSYRATGQAEQEVASVDPQEARATLVWIAVYHHGHATAEELAETISMDDDALADALELLAKDGRIRYEESTEGDAAPVRRYVCDAYLIPYGSDVGWAAAVFDHYQALVGAICAKLHSGTRRSTKADEVGGSTFNFDVWAGHPFEDEVVGLLGELRDRAHTLRRRVDAYNDTVTMPKRLKRTVFYLGQNVLYDEEEADE